MNTAKLTKIIAITMMAITVIHIVNASIVKSAEPFVLGMPYTWGMSYLIYIIATCVALFFAYYGAELEKKQLEKEEAMKSG
jgi:hypothetical protein